jgi:hypothetical protein
MLLTDESRVLSYKSETNVVLFVTLLVSGGKSLTSGPTFTAKEPLEIVRGRLVAH